MVVTKVLSKSRSNEYHLRSEGEICRNWVAAKAGPELGLSVGGIEGRYCPKCIVNSFSTIAKLYPIVLLQLRVHSCIDR